MGRETLIARRDLPGLPYWQEMIFVWLARNAARAMAYYRLLEERVLEKASLTMRVVLPSPKAGSFQIKQAVTPVVSLIKMVRST